MYLENIFVGSEDIRPIHIDEGDMIADGYTKYIPAAVYMRHFYYILNKAPSTQLARQRRASPSCTCTGKTPRTRS